MEFRTTIKNVEGRCKILHSHRLMLIGSCFSDNIGSRMHNALMQVDVNPFGTVYNPASILNEVKHIISGAPITADNLFHANGMWNHFGFHSHFSREDKDEALKVMNNRLQEAHKHLAGCDIVIVTLGTAFVYELKSSGHIVSNCHKLHANEFNRRLLTVGEVHSCLNDIVRSISEYAPQAKIIFTLSPIRHIADGLEQNQLSKSTLRVAIGKIVAERSDKCEYFPAYEIMMDDLRDYRFYATDMVHPSDVAIEYIWNAFKAAYFNDSTAQTVARCERIAKRLGHRPMTDNREALARFHAETTEIVNKLAEEYPYLRNLPQFHKYFVS